MRNIGCEQYIVPFYIAIGKDYGTTIEKSKIASDLGEADLLNAKIKRREAL